MISVRGLTHSFSGRVVLSDIDLEVAPHEILAVMGSSGGGKTTLLRCISGLITPTKGEVDVDGVNVRSDPEEARRHMGMVFQSAALFDYMNVRDNVLFGLKRLKKQLPAAPEKLADDALARVGLKGSESLMPAELSGGMRKRVGIARAIALQPKVLLYDEPTTGLDPITTYTIDAFIREVRDTLGATTMLVSHDVTSVVRTSDRVAFLENGKLTFLGTPIEFLRAKNEAIREIVLKSQIALDSPSIVNKGGTPASPPP
ncbi:MAG: phospholipid/cholesterol/gamma-HCH transport system ATP-binding protein [Fimbriimonadaceae bacterium]|jgi:phospholipid/cholesterol/gamma-HCH transport system ATP-binding protein|nr:phospholipid/cholesterol/gamma-HCH transport system ATP-binding protein [Fimbriimonadaceae bacterium]